MARKQKPTRIERGLYRAGKTYLACATPAGARKAKWKTIGLMEARRERDTWAVESAPVASRRWAAGRRSRRSPRHG